MNQNTWYQQSQQDLRQQYQNSSSNRPTAGTDSVRDAQRLLAVYPFGSATPTTHVQRHIGGLSLTATPPSYWVQPSMYSAQMQAPAQTYSPAYTEYAAEIAHLSSAATPYTDNGYWAATRNDAVRYIGEQALVSPHAEAYPPQWQNGYSTTTYQTTPFAQSIFQHTSPSASYPTPPPPGIISSSSSLAMALGEPKPKATAKVYHAEESADFFNSFIEQQAARQSPKSVNTDESMQLTPRRRAKGVSSSRSSSGPPTPSRKRKAEHVSELASAKRPHPVQAQRISHTTNMSFTSATNRPKLQAYVELPAVPLASRSSSSQLHSQSDFLRHLSNFEKNAGRADDSENVIWSSSEDGRHKPQDTAQKGKRPTGDDRAPLEKLMVLLEDIFEAEDSLPPEPTVTDLSQDFFSPLSFDYARPTLHPNLIRKIVAQISKIARPTKRLRQYSREAGGASPKKSTDYLTDVEIASLSRVLRILERGVKAGEDLDPFGTMSSRPSLVEHTQKVESKDKKKAKKKIGLEENRAQSKTPSPVGEDEGMGYEASNVMSAVEGPNETEKGLLYKGLQIAKDSVIAADCCLTLLASSWVTKQLYSEELIMTCFSTVKNHLTQIIYPFVEASSEMLHDRIPPLLYFLLRPDGESDSERLRKEVAEVFRAISAVLHRINDLISADKMSMSESIIIQAVYIAIDPFFIVDTAAEGKGKDRKDNMVVSTLGASAMRGLRLEALALIRNIFACYEDQRSWIVEEILSSLIKLSDSKQKAGQFRLRDGRSIRTVSALLLQLIQTSAHDVRVQARIVCTSRQQAIALRRQGSAHGKDEEPALDEKDMEELRLYTCGLDSAHKVARTIILFLTQRSGKAKTTKNANENEYRTIFDNLITDLLTVLFWPEWPAASILLGVASKYMISSLDDVGSSNQTENTAAKTVALDHLGVVGARIRASMSKLQGDHEPAFGSLEEVLSTGDMKRFEALSAAHQTISTYLARRSSDDQSYESAKELTTVLWGQELAQALKDCAHNMEDVAEESDGSNTKTHRNFTSVLKATLQGLWMDGTVDVFEVGNVQDEAAHIDILAEKVGITQSLRHSFNPILAVILKALDAPPVFMRTKAIRALGQIIMSDPTILSSTTVRHSIETHLLDSSPAVRDAAVELIGKYIIDSPNLAGEYYSRIADRIADTGLSVRKRVIKLLKIIYTASVDIRRRVDASTRIILRMFDEDDTIKELAVKTMEELWFTDSLLKDGSIILPQSRVKLLDKVTVIMSVSSNFKDRQSPLEDLLYKIINDKEGGEASALHARYAEICEVLIDGLVDASDLPGFTVINCVRTIYIFTVAYPAVLSTTHVSTLLPYLKNPTTNEEQLTSDYLLRIFRASLPFLPKTAHKFGQDLELALQPMILKPSPAAGLSGLQETVACMCTVVQHLTYDFKKLVSLLKSCSGRLHHILTRPAIRDPQLVRTLSILVFIAALLCEHCDFEKLKSDPNLQPEIETISPGGTINVHVYRIFLGLYAKFDDGSIRNRLLQCLGFLFKAQPALLTAETSADIMDQIFASDDSEARARLLKIMQEFLISESEKHLMKEKAASKIRQPGGDIDMEELIGNTDGFADSGVSSAMVQRYIENILSSSLSQNPHIQAAAVDILTFTIKQGLAHPLQCFPFIVALETSNNSAMSGRASGLHTILHSKHTSLLNARYVASARASFDYQKTLVNGPVQGYRLQPNPIALLHRWYSLIREKRVMRQDFLKALVRVFDIEIAKSTQDDVEFARYMAENFSAFDYKTQEEVLTLLKYLTNVLSTTGMQLMELLSPSYLLEQLHDPTTQGNISEQSLVIQKTPVLTNKDLQGQLSLARSAVVIGIIMLLKEHLKNLYGISEEKCAKWVVGKKSAIGDRPATRRHDQPLLWNRLPYAISPIRTSEDIRSQRNTLLHIWSEDGLHAEPEDDLS